jgi:hypothetical protein
VGKGGGVEKALRLIPLFCAFFALFPDFWDLALFCAF